jgi:hypothetical protein
MVSKAKMMDPSWPFSTFHPQMFLFSSCNKSWDGKQVPPSPVGVQLRVQRSQCESKRDPLQQDSPASPCEEKDRHDTGSVPCGSARPMKVTVSSLPAPIWLVPAGHQNAFQLARSALWSWRPLPQEQPNTPAPSQAVGTREDAAV